MSRASRPHNVPAAGTLLWRRGESGLEVLLVHRAKYDDWSWAKGKLDPGEAWAVATARETLEETGLRPRLGIELPRSRYRLPKGDEKHVRYWAASVAGGHGRLENEIDKVTWASPKRARTLLTQPRLGEQLDALVAADEEGLLDTWPLLVVRHAHARPRASWQGDDALRTLDEAGLLRANRIAPIIAAYDIRSVVSSPSQRCIQTIRPFAALAEAPVKTKKGLSEEGFRADPTKAVKHTMRLLAGGAPAALCTHGPVLPTVLACLADAAAPGSRTEHALEQLTSRNMEKGEVLVCHVRGNGPGTQIVATQTYRPSVPGE